MSKSVEETRRELFEAWDSQAFADFDHEKDRLGDYVDNIVHQCWMAFNAALDAVEIKLPKHCAYESLDEHRVFVRLTYELDEHSTDAVELCRRDDAIKSVEILNLGLKIK